MSHARVRLIDTLTTDRVYLSAFSQSKAVAILRDEAAQGLHNPELVEKFIALVQS